MVRVVSYSDCNMDNEISFHLAVDFVMNYVFLLLLINHYYRFLYTRLLLAVTQSYIYKAFFYSVCVYDTIIFTYCYWWM